jgi:hypothetical protein
MEKFVSKATSSQLARNMRAHGELYAKDLLAIADEEPGPELLPLRPSPIDTGVQRTGA